MLVGNSQFLLISCVINRSLCPKQQSCKRDHGGLGIAAPRPYTMSTLSTVEISSLWTLKQYTVSSSLTSASGYRRVDYRISLNRCRPRIVAAQSEALGRNRCHPQIVAAASKCGTCSHVRRVSDDGHHTSARTVCVARTSLSTADSRSERLCVLLTAST